MKKFCRSIICLLLSAMIVFSGASAAFAKSNVTPVIVVHGMGGSPLYLNPDTEDEQLLGNIDISMFFGVYNNLLKKVLSATAGNPVDAEDLLDEIADYMKEYSALACDKNGNSVEDVKIKNYFEDSYANHKDYLERGSKSEPALSQSICRQIGAENVFAFNYDWRLDACENAEKLNKFIDSVKEQTGKSKVTLVSCSEGTVVVSAYIDAHKNKNDIKKTVFVNGALYGVSVTNLLGQDILIDKDVLLDYIYNITHTLNSTDTDIELKKLSFLSYTMSDSVGNLCDLLNEIIKTPSLKKKLYNEILKPVFGQMPIMWEFIPYDGFDTAVSKMTKIGFLEKGSGLYKKIKKYHGVQGRLKSNLKELKSKGVEVAIIANYGIPSIPATSQYNNQADILIDTKYASVGATVADFGDTLNAKGKYVSADRVIDASSCVLPDNTWFIKGIQHMQFLAGAEATEFVATLATTDVKLNISSIEKKTGVGQFMGTDAQQNIISVTETGVSSQRIVNESSSNAESSEIKSPLTGASGATGIALASALLTAALASVVIRKKIK
ncbi:MAG: hypothetical protein ACI4IK_07395 [Eubacterium sp.]